MVDSFDLSGEWKLKMYDGIKASDYVFSDENHFSDVIILPSTTALSQKGNKNNKKEEWHLTEVYPFSGSILLSKVIYIKDIYSADSEKNKYHLYMERTRITRVWINGNEITSCNTDNSLVAPHIYDITDGIYKCVNVNQQEVRIDILVSNLDYPTPGGHLTSPDTQTNWCGILGKISIDILPEVYINSVDVRSEFINDIPSFKVRLELGGKGFCDTEINIKLYEYDSRYNEVPFILEKTFILDAALSLNKSFPELVISSDRIKPWSEYERNLYKIEISIPKYKEVYITDAGFRIIKTSGMDILLNNQKVFLRGKHDGMVFPLTGAAPTDVKGWLKVMEVGREYGINHYRFHTCCPPDAAFTAADMLGIYMSPELEFWGTINAPGEEGFNEAEQEFLIKEGELILKHFGNHPSFTMLSLGNELWGNEKRLGEIISHLKGIRDDKLFTQGSNNFQFMPKLIPEDDYFVGVRFDRNRLIRGSYAQCDAPLGFVQTQEPAMNHSYDLDEINKPVISHEIGQYCIYPSIKDENKYTGVLKAGQYEIYRERLKRRGLENLAEDFTKASGKLAVQCYKLELEAAHKSRGLSGYQILDLQDFPGQGGAFVGILDAFMDSKGLISPKLWKAFCNDTVVMAAFDSFIYESGSEFTAEYLISNYNPALFPEDLELVVEISREHEAKQESKLKERKTIDSVVLRLSPQDLKISNTMGISSYGKYTIRLPEVEKPAKINLKLSLKHKDEDFKNIRVETEKENGKVIGKYDVYNSYELYVFPKNQHLDSEDKVREQFNKDGIEIVSDLKNLESLNEKAVDKILYLPESFEDGESISGMYATDFWCYPMFRNISESMGKEVPIGTLGLLIDSDHPVFEAFPTEFYSTPVWYNLVSDSQMIIEEKNVLEEKNYVNQNKTADQDDFRRIIVRCIDNIERAHSLGMLMEERINGKYIMTCTSHLLRNTDKIEVRAFINSLYLYLKGVE